MRHTFWPPRLGVGDSGKRSQQVSVAEPSSGWALRPQTEPAFRDGNLPHWGFFSIDTQLVLRQTWGLSWIFKTYPFALVLLISCKSVQNSKTLTLNFSQFFGNIKKNILRKVEQILNKDKSMRLRQLGTVLGSWPRKDKTYTVSCDNLFPPKFSKESRDLACLPMIWKANHVLERLFLTLSLKAWQSDHRKEPNAVMGFSDGFPKVLGSPRSWLPGHESVLKKLPLAFPSASGPLAAVERTASSHVGHWLSFYLLSPAKFVWDRVLAISKADSPTKRRQKLGLNRENHRPLWRVERQEWTVVWQEKMESFKKRGVYGGITPSEWKHPRVLGSGLELNSLPTLYQQAVSNTISD